MLSKLPANKPVWVVGIPTQYFYVGAFHLVVVLHAGIEAVHEGGHGGELDAAEGADLAGLGDGGSQVTGQEAGLVDGVDLPRTLGIAGS